MFGEKSFARFLNMKKEEKNLVSYETSYVRRKLIVILMVRPKNLSENSYAYTYGSNLFPTSTSLLLLLMLPLLANITRRDLHLLKMIM